MCVRSRGRTVTWGDVVEMGVVGTSGRPSSPPLGQRAARRAYFEITVFTMFKHAEANPIVIFYNSPPHVAIWGLVEGGCFQNVVVRHFGAAKAFIGERRDRGLHTHCRERSLLARVEIGVGISTRSAAVGE